MSAPTIFASVVTNPGGTGSTIVPTLSTHATGDVLEIFIGKTGNVAWSAPAGWTTKQQLIIGTASNGLVGTLIYRRVLPGDTLPLPSPTCNLGATVTRGAICQTRRGTDIESVHTLTEWLAFGTGTGTANPIRPSSITTPAPEMEVSHYYCQRAATNAPEPTSYTQTQQIVISGTLVINVATRTIADQQTALANQDASPTSGARWVGMISAAPSPEYPYYRSGSQAFSANATNVTPALPTGTTASDNRGNKDLIVATIECAGSPTIAPNTPADWTALPDWSNTTSGGGTTVRKYRTLYDGSLDRQFNRSTSGEIFVYFSVYHNAHQSIPVGTSATQQNASSTTSTFPALPRTGTKNTVQATCVADGTQTFTAPSGYTERNDSQGVTCADQSFNATGTTASASFTLSSASPTLAGLMEVFSVASVINLILTPATASLTLTTFAPAIDINVTVTPGAASLTLTTFAPAIIVPADFPFTGLLDNFNRADGGLGANWGEKLFDGDDVLAIDTNLVKGVNGGINNSQGWATQLGPDVEVFIEIVSGSGNQVLLAVRWTALDTGTPDGYAVRSRGGAVDNVVLFRFDNGSPIGLATIPQEVDDGDWLGLRIVGDVLTVYYIDISVSPNWVLIGEETDATYSVAGHIGILLESNAGRVDNFSGGTIGDITVEPTTAVVTLTTFAPELTTTLTAQAASLTLTTFAPSLRLDITPTPAVLTATAFTPQLREFITPANASLSVATFAPSVTVLVTVPAASLTLITFAPDVAVTAHVTVMPASASLTLTLFAVQLREVITPASESLSLTTHAPKLIEIATPTTTNLSLTTFAPTITTNTIVTPASTTLTLTSTAPQLRETVTPSAASLSLASFAPSITATADVTVTPAAASLTITGFVSVLHEQVTPSVATLTLTTFAPEITISADITVEPTTQILTLTPFAPALQLVITPATGSLSLSTFEPTITVSADKVVTPPAASLTLQTFAPQLQLQVQPTVAALALSAFAPVVETGGDVTITPGSATLTLVTFAPILVDLLSYSAVLTVISKPSATMSVISKPEVILIVIQKPLVEMEVV